MGRAFIMPRILPEDSGQNTSSFLWIWAAYLRLNKATVIYSRQNDACQQFCRVGRQAEWGDESVAG